LILSGIAVLVTGAGGLIGNRLVPNLLSRGHRVVATARRNISPVSGCKVVVGDLLETRVRQDAIATLLHGDERRLAIVHLAAMSDAAQARGNRGQAFATNTLLVEQLLADCADHGIRCFLMASTGLVYATRGMEPLTEDSPTFPRSLYSATKLAAEMMVRGYACDFGLRGEILRFSNVYGPTSPENTVMGRILNQLRRGGRVSVDSREPVRDFIYVDDAVDAVSRLLETEVESGTYATNVSTGEGTSIGDLADRASAVAVGSTYSPRKSCPAEDALVLSNRMLRERISWQPQFSLMDGLTACLSAERR
jgi:UDP-glucose 4-epimerase